MQTETLDLLKKIWIPVSHEFNAESSIAQYIAGKGMTAKDTLRFAQVRGKTFNELFIPSAMLEADEHDMYAQCYASLTALHAGMVKDNMVTASATVDYTTATFAGPKP